MGGDLLVFLARKTGRLLEEGAVWVRPRSGVFGVDSKQVDKAYTVGCITGTPPCDLVE